QRAGDVHPVGEASDAWQTFAESHFRNRCLDGLHLPLNFARSVRLRIKRFMLRRRAVEEKEDAGFGLRSLCARRGEQVADRGAERAESANVQEVAAGEAVTE